MADEPYEILPHREVASLKRDIADLKQKVGSSSSKQLADSMANLSKTMDHMLNLFQTTAEEMKLEEEGGSPAGLAEINSKLDELIDQNKTIAEGIVAIADMIKGEKSESALQEVLTRAKEALQGVPEETREPLPDGNTKYARPLPGAERMYPETDIPSLVITSERKQKIKKELPELPHVKLKRFINQYNLTDEHAVKILHSGYEDLFEETQEYQLKSTLFIKVIDILKNVERSQKYVQDEKQLEICLEQLAKGKIVKEALDEILPALADGKKMSEITVETVSRADVEEIIKKVVEANINVIGEKGMRAVAPLMGQCMKELRGKADGKLVNDILTAEVEKVLSKV